VIYLARNAIFFYLAFESYGNLHLFFYFLARKAVDKNASLITEEKREIFRFHSLPHIVKTITCLLIARRFSRQIAIERFPRNTFREWRVTVALLGGKIERIHRET